MTKRWVATFALMLALLGCGGGGGGGGSYEAPAGPPPVVREGSLFGYYGDFKGDLVETHSHVNVAWTMGWGEGDYYQGVQSQIARAMTYGVPVVVLGLPNEMHGNEAFVRDLFLRLRSQGLLGAVKVLYPMDEPDDRGKTDAQMNAFNAVLRRVAAEFPELSGVKLAVIYTRAQKWPGISTFDWVGFDDYNAGTGVLMNDTWQDMKSRLRPDQRIMLIPGGSDPWAHDPAPFVAKLAEDPQVIGIIAFAWGDAVDSGVGLGVRSNSRKHDYCSTGMRIKTLNPTVECPQ